MDNKAHTWFWLWWRNRRTTNGNGQRSFLDWKLNSEWVRNIQPIIEYWWDILCIGVCSIYVYTHISIITGNNLNLLKDVYWFREKWRRITRWRPLSQKDCNFNQQKTQRRIVFQLSHSHCSRIYHSILNIRNNLLLNAYFEWWLTEGLGIQTQHHNSKRIICCVDCLLNNACCVYLAVTCLGFDQRWISWETFP